jgi:hypothetical protein
MQIVRMMKATFSQQAAASSRDLRIGGVMALLVALLFLAGMMALLVATAPRPGERATVHPLFLVLAAGFFGTWMTGMHRVIWGRSPGGMPRILVTLGAGVTGMIVVSGIVGAIASLVVGKTQ